MKALCSKIFWITVLVFTINVFAREDDSLKTFVIENPVYNAGVSLDAVAYYYGGYDVSFWISYGYFKLRGNYSLKYPPEFTNQKNFKNLSYKSVGLYFDYFPFTTGVKLNGIWFGLGLERSEGSIENTYYENRKNFEDFFLNGTVGYLFFVGHNIYFNPFFAGHLKLWGSGGVTYGGDKYIPQKFIPEISFRIGCAF